ncbi:UDP-glucose 4-epimerase GalE [Mangrovibacterium lignilyticum]|uniref:UDP-glucose 4-epimerase GalE n=1 Tax=Mangrovibacterium lignilyticum TaxID=2668052 RepID=UPI0013D039F9|nr:UDP-glucose 4-epimerase GalE [Mangrovibacterium lignilyticum]
MKVIVTGGLGFIGSHTVVELWNSGFEPVIVDNLSNSNESVLSQLNELTGKQTTCYKIDCTEVDMLREIIREEKPEGIIHFAAHKAVGESVKEPLKYYGNNVNSTLVLINLMREIGIKNLIFSSSCTVYGEPDSIPVTEQNRRKKATSPYGNTKAICEDIIENSVHAYQCLRATSLRYFNPIGAHPSGLIGELPLGVPNNLVPYITQTAVGKRPKLTVFGNDYDTADGTCVRDFIHVVDLAQAHVAALNFLISSKSESLYEVFNIGTGSGNSVLELIQCFEEVNSVKLNYEFGSRREGDIEKIYGCADKARAILGWKSNKTLQEALADAYRWERRLLESN